MNGSRLLAFLGMSAAACASVAAFGAPQSAAAPLMAAANASDPPTASPAAVSTTASPALSPSPSPSPHHRSRYRSVFGFRDKPPTEAPSPLPPGATPLANPAVGSSATLAPLPAKLASPVAVPLTAPLPAASAGPARSAVSPTIAPAATPATARTPAPERTPAPATGLQPTIPQSMLDPDVRRVLGAGLPQLKRFDWMAGTWSARNVEELPSGASRDLGLNTYVFAYTMKKHWFFGADGKAKDEFYITYDPFVSRYILIRLEGNPTYGIWTSPDGWRGNRIVFSGVFTVAVGRLYQRRLTIIHKDARDFGIYDEEQLPNGTWSADDAVELTKQP